MNNSICDNKSYTISQAADLLRVSSAFIHRIIFTDKIKITSNRISEESIKEYLSKHGEYLERVRSDECLRR